MHTLIEPNSIRPVLMLLQQGQCQYRAVDTFQNMHEDSSAILANQNALQAEPPSSTCSWVLGHLGSLMCFTE